MRTLNDWVSEDYRTLLHFRAPVLQIFCEHIQFGNGIPESGGILLGSEHGSHFEVTEATKPTKWDVRSLFSFSRHVKGHRARANRVWRNSNGTIGYIGEWHTHPEDYPTPSGRDRFEWQKLLHKRGAGSPLLVVIVGRKGMYVELLHSPKRMSAFHTKTERLKPYEPLVTLPPHT